MKRLHIRILCFSIFLNFQFLILNSVHAQDTVHMTFDSCLSYAYGHSPTVLTAMLQREAAAAALEQARWNFTPTLAASASADMALFRGTTTTNTSYGAGASWTLFDGLNNVNTLRNSKAEQQRSDLGVEKSRHDVAVQIINSYLEILANQERLQYLAELNASSQKQAQDAEARYNAGRLLESDYLLLKANWKRAESDMNNASFVIENGIQRLRNLIGLSDSIPLAVVPLDTTSASSPMPSVHWPMTSEALDSLPEMQMYRLELEKAHYQLNMAKGGHMPQLGLNAYASYYGGDHVRTDAGGMLVTSGGINTTLSLGLSVPILNRGYTRLQVKQARLGIQQAELQMRQMRDEMQQQLAERYRNLQQARNTLEACQIMLYATQASLQTYQAKYQTGTVTASELLQQEERYLSALNEYLQSKYTYIISDKILQIYIGK